MVVEYVLQVCLRIAVKLRNCLAYHLGEGLVSKSFVVPLEVVIEEQHAIALTVLAHPGCISSDSTDAHKE